MKTRLAATGLALVLTTAAPAQAAMLVYDATSYAKLIEQARTSLDQLQQLKSQVEQGQKLFESLNEASGIGGIAKELAAPALRQVLPQVTSLVSAVKGDASMLGAIGTRADALRAAARLYTAATGDPLGADLEAAGARAARDLALGEAVATAGSARLSGLQALQTAIETAPNARAVLDLQARAATEQAMIANDQMRMQGLAMAQAAEERLQAQRQQERRLAEADARMAIYKRAFE